MDKWLTCGTMSNVSKNCAKNSSEDMVQPPGEKRFVGPRRRLKNEKNIHIVNLNDGRRNDRPRTSRPSGIVDMDGPKQHKLERLSGTRCLHRNASVYKDYEHSNYCQDIYRLSRSCRYNLLLCCHRNNWRFRIFPFESGHSYSAKRYSANWHLGNAIIKGCEELCRGQVQHSPRDTIRSYAEPEPIRPLV